MRLNIVSLIISLSLIWIITVPINAEPNVLSFMSNNLQLSDINKNHEFSVVQTNYDDVNRIKNSLILTENEGQIENENIRFYAPNGALWFTNDGVWYELREEIKTRNQGLSISDLNAGFSWDPIEKLESPEVKKYKQIILKQEFVDTNNVQPVGRGCLSFNSNFFYGNDSSEWYTNVHHYQEIFYKNIYDRIDLRYYSNNNGLKYDFIVKPGANINQIKIKYKGANEIIINELGDLIVKTDIKNIFDGNLRIYQDINNKRQYLDGNFELLNDLEYGFKINDDFCPQEPLIIDPFINLDYSTYIGQVNYDSSRDIAVDLNGNAYITGSTQSPNFPTTPGVNDTTYNGGSYDIFVLKLDQNGSNLVYSTFIGGANSDYGRSIGIDQKGNAYVTGDTRSSNFPTTSNAFDLSYNDLDDVIVIKLNEFGSKLIYSTFIGGNDTERGYGIDVDSNDEAYVTGYTQSSDFPIKLGSNDTTYNGNDDVFIVKLNKSGSKLIYSSFIGGINDDVGYDITIDTSNNALITGYTKSSNFPITNGANDTTINGFFDVFVLKINQMGSILIYSTFIGGSGSDYGRAIVLDSNNNAYITGRTRSSNFPTTPNAFNSTYDTSADAFIFKLDINGSQLLFSTYISGNGYDEGNGIDVDSMNNIYISGHTTSSNFPITNNAFNSTLNSRDVFLLKLASNGSTLIYSTFFGGSGSDYGEGIILDSQSNAFITGRTYSTDFPWTNNAYNLTYGGGGDAFISKFSFKSILNISSVKLIQNNDPKTLIYSKFTEYTFKINVIDTASLTDLEQVKLILDPTGINIQLIWNQLTGQFIKINDPNNFITIEPTSKVFNNSIQKWIVDFNVTFNWTYPDEDFHDIQVQAISSTLSSIFYNSTNFYKVENDLVFNGSLIVIGEDNRIVNNNDLVRGGECLTWTGLNVVYENTTDVYPPGNEFDITICDELKNSWVDSTETGQPFLITLNASTNTRLDGCNYRINISGIPEECDKTNLIHIIRIDGNNVTFLKPKPNNLTWQNTIDVAVEITIKDTGGGFVNGSTVKRSISKNDGISWTNWESIFGLSSGENITVNDVITFEEGNGNLIKWQAEDSVGNGPSESEPYRIFVDTKEVEFSHFWPNANEVSKSENVNLGITITDTTSGINASTIEYSISKDKGKIWSKWNKVKVEGLFNGSKKVDIIINLTFLNGTDNYLKWRASDIAGNGPTESQPIIINVNTWEPLVKPKVILQSPLNGIKINETSIELSWALDDPKVNDIIYDIYFQNTTPPGIFKENITNTSYIIENLINGETYYWQVIPKSENVVGKCASGLWWFVVDIPQEEIFFKISIAGINSILLYQGDTKNITLVITNLGTVKDEIKLDIKSGKLTDYISLDDHSNLNIDSKTYNQRNLIVELPNDVQAGVYEIIVTATSINSEGKVKESHIISVEVKEKVINGPNGPKPNDPQENITSDPEDKLEEIILYSMIIIIIIIVVLVISFFVIKRKRDKEKEVLPSDSVTTKPIPTHVINIGDAPSTIDSPQLSEPTIETQSVSGEISAGAISTPTIQKSPTVGLPPQQMPGYIQTPQLPPAQPTLAEPVPTLSTDTSSTQLTTKEVPSQIQSRSTVASVPTLASVPSQQPGPSVHLPDSEQKKTNEDKRPED